MKSKLFDYIERDNVIYRLSGLTKLLCFIMLTFSVMFTYDIRSILVILVFSFGVLRYSGISFSQIKVMIYYVLTFLVLNFVLTFLFDPQYGVSIYGTSHEIFRLNDRYVMTLEQLLYQVTKFVKYVSVIPLGMIFLLTTNPSEFAASISNLGCNYKGAYAVSLTLRYFPDMIRTYDDIALAQQSRGLDLSKKEKVMTRLKNIMNICIPLVFTTLDRIEMISNAMDLRGFGKKKKRTWYAQKRMTKADVISLLICGAILATVLYITVFINKGRFFNPFL
ncbi:MAG: energy-coupling factor transporter transmembrane component T [Lachnospiraceae bacterium]